MRTVVAIIEKNGDVLSFARNLEHDCKRIGYPTGQCYELCEGCQPHNHAEQLALRAERYPGATLHLFGHTYACEPCKTACADAGVAITIH